MREIKVSVLLLLSIVLLSGCVRHNNPAFSSASNRFDGESYDAFFMGGENQETRKVLYSAWLNLAVKDPDSTAEKIALIAEKYNGYVNEKGTYKNIIRVKSNQLEAAIEDISSLGKIRRKNITGQDVTEDYFDYQIRLENAEKARERYLELLAQAETVEAALKVEKELERLNEKIDLLKGKINRIDHLDKYSTITVYLEERTKPGVLGYVALGLYHSVKWLFVRN